MPRMAHFFRISPSCSGQAYGSWRDLAGQDISAQILKFSILLAGMVDRAALARWAPWAHSHCNTLRIAQLALVKRVAGNHAVCDWRQCLEASVRRLFSRHSSLYTAPLVPARLTPSA